MANIDAAYGFRPIAGSGGEQPATLSYEVTASNTVCTGDLVTIQDAGTVVQSTAGDGDAVVGVAANYVGSSDTDRTVQVWPADGNILFEAQCSGTMAATDVGRAYDHTNGTQVTWTDGYNPKRANTNGQSAAEIDTSTSGTSGLQFVVVGLLDTPNNAWGANSRVIVKFLEGQFVGGSSGV